MALDCQVCHYEPDEADLKFTNYNLKKCSVCGRLACDLCLIETTKGLVCAVCTDTPVIGQKRKFWLKEEYPVELRKVIDSCAV